MRPTKFRFICLSGFTGEDFQKSVNQKLELPVGVSEEKIKMWKANGRQTTEAKWWQKLTLPIARWAKKFVNKDSVHNLHNC
jgi:hypothetical protein